MLAVHSKSTAENHIVSSVLKRVSTLEGYIERTKKKLKTALAVIKEKDLEIIKLKEKVSAF